MGKTGTGLGFLLLLLVAGCRLPTETFDVSFKIERAYAYGKRIDLAVTVEGASSGQSGNYWDAPGFLDALSLDAGTLVLTGWDTGENRRYGRLATNRAVLPSDPDTFTLAIDRSTALGTFTLPADYNLAERITYFRFAEDQADSVPVIRPLFVQITTVTNDRWLEIWAYDAANPPWVGSGSLARSISFSGNTLFALSYRGVDHWGYSAPSVDLGGSLVCLSARGTTLDEFYYLTSTGTHSNTPVAFDGSTTLQPGMLVSIDSGFFLGSDSDD